MAKKFLDLYKETKEKVYSNEAQALTVLASLNSAVDFTPNLAPNGAAGTTSQYTIQRRKRPAVNVVANPNSGATTDALAALDQLTTIDWISQEVVTGKLKSVGFKETIEDNFDFSESPKHSRDMMYQVGEIALQRKADFLALFETFPAAAAVLPAHKAGASDVWEALADEVLRLGRIDDEFKSKQGVQEFIIVMSGDIAKDITKEVGQVFNQEAPIAMTGFTSGKSINGTPVIVDTTLDAGTYYIMHKEALGFKSVMIEKDINVDLGLSVYTGKFFYDIMAVVDTARVVKHKK